MHTEGRVNCTTLGGIARRDGGLASSSPSSSGDEFVPILVEVLLKYTGGTPCVHHTPPSPAGPLHDPDVSFDRAHLVKAWMSATTVTINLALAAL